ncbi:MAG: hypothetical protein ACQCN6_08470 [Candidatus Bathyarchaeia archaeon]
MKEKVAVATVRGKAYFLIVNMLRECGIPFVSVVPGEPVSSKVKLAITTPDEKLKVAFERVLVFNGQESELEGLAGEVKKQLLGKEAYEKVVIGIDPGAATGLAVIADGKIIEESNCYSSHELITSIQKFLKSINFQITAVTVKIGNGTPVYRELLEYLDYALPPQVVLEVVGEAGTSHPLRENRHSRKIRHISSAIHIAGRIGNCVHRRKAIAANSPTQ